MGRYFLRHCVLSLAALSAVPSAAKAAMTGQIPLRGFVPARAAINVVGLASAMVVDFRNTLNGTATLRLSRFTNNASGVSVSLAATGSRPTLDGADGEVVPYTVRFGGRDIEFTDGMAQLASGQAREEPGTSEDELQIIAPRQTAASDKGYSARLVLVITAP